MSQDPKGRSGSAVEHFSAAVEEFHGYYDSRAEFQERTALWRPLLDKYMVRGGQAIDMGSGTGVFSFYLAERGATVLGIDGAPDMVKFCEAQRLERGVENIRFIEARLPEVGEAELPTADLIISSSVVEYVPDLEATFRLFVRQLRAGGHLIVSMPNVHCINRRYERLKHTLTGQPEIYRHILHFTSPRRLQRRVAPLGLSTVQVHYYTHYTRLAKLTRRLGLPPAMTEDLFVAVFRKS